MKANFLGRVLTPALLGFALTLRAADIDPPAIQSVSPVNGANVSTLTQVTVTFNEPVTGVELDDFLINGLPASTRSGANSVWTFTFNQPTAGLVQFSWDGSHAIYDLAGNRFNELAPSSSWSCTLADMIAPTALVTAPSPGATVAALTQIEVTFQEPVTGVDFADLRVNGLPAASVTGAGAGPYFFSFNQPGSGAVSVSWAGGHGIADTAAPPNAFAGGAWSYTLDTSFSPNIVINEILAENLNGILDEDRDTSDWIELSNRGATAVNLLGWSLTDDTTKPDQWVFPSVTLNAGQYLLVFASGKNRKVAAPGTNHTSFTLAPSEYLGLYNAQLPRQMVSEFAPTYAEQRGDLSFGRTAANALTYFATATPRAVNSTGTNYSGLAAMPHASVNSGMFSQLFQVGLGCETPGAAIYYTLNGDQPTPASGTLYRGLITIAGTPGKAVIPLRAAAYKTGLLSSPVLTRTYIFPDHVLKQPIAPTEFPTQWVTGRGMATTSGDYEMDPQVLTNGSNTQIARQALGELPVVSIVASVNTLFASNTGVYTARLKQGNQRQVNAEMWLPNGERVFQADCGLEIQGGSSPSDASGNWKDKKLSLRLIFKGDFGTPKLKARVFDDTPVNEFDTIQLDAGLNYWWTHMTDSNQRERAKFITDQFTSDLMNNAGMVAQHGRHVHLYLNGLYWGLHDLHERMDEAAAASYLGGQKEEWDVIKHTGDSAGLQNGTLTNYQAMFTLARSGLANNSTYQQIQSFLDLPWFADYMLVNLWVGNTDWANHNWYAWRRSRTPGSLPWRFVSWDAEHTVKSVTENRLSVSEANSPGELFQLLRNNAEFRVLFGDRVHRLMFNGGALAALPDTVAFWNPTNPLVNVPASTYRKRVDEIWNSVVCESARWGDVATANANSPYTREVHYARELNGLYAITNVGGTPNYFPLRGSNVLSQLRSAGLYPTVAAPAFSKHGGRVTPGFGLLVTNRNGVGAVYYTTNGSDPRVAGAGTVSPQAIIYAAVPIAIGQTMTIKARALSGTNWSALNEATFTTTLGVPLRITEIMYNPPAGPAPSTAYEFIELMNVGLTDLNLGNYSLDGVTYVFPPNYLLDAGARIVLASDSLPAAFAQRYPGVVVAGSFNGSLNNAGERLAILDAAGHTVVSIEYGGDFGWPPSSADAGGASIEIIDVEGNPDSPSNWRVSSTPNGTPGLPSGAPPVPTVILNEVMAENLSFTNNGGSYPDWVELYNAGAGSANLTGWSLSDNANPRRFVFTNGPTLAPGDYLVVWFDTNNAAPGLHTGFGLDRDGGSVFLFDANTNRVDAFDFGAQLADRSIGRSGGGWALNTPTPGAGNLTAATASVASLVINEWLANASPGGSDWVELYNPSALPVALNGIYLGTSNAVFRYTTPAFAPPGGFLQLLADELTGPRHLDFKLPAAGGAIVLYDTAGLEINRATYGPQAENVSQGRLPDGSNNVIAFPGSGSPQASNYLLTYSGPLLNEVLARNDNGDYAPWGERADWVEIANTNSGPVDLGGLGLSDEPGAPKWLFPAGTTLGGNSTLRIWCDSGQPASTEAGANLNTGFSLSAESGGVYLFHTGGQAVDVVEYGFQVADLSLGRSSSAWRLLSSPTPNAANSAPATLGSATALRINEWMSAPARGNDWFELYNTASAPVELSGLYVTDDPSLAGYTMYQVAPLSFIGAKDFVTWEADGDPSQGREHVNFNLNDLGDSLRLYAASLALIDGVDFGPIPTGASMGRLPDSGASIVPFNTTPTPSESNYLPLPNALINEVLAHTDPPLEDAVELFNPTGTPVAIGGWYLSNSRGDFKKYRIPDGISIPAAGFAALYEVQFNSGPGGFTLDSAHGDGIYLSAADGAGNLTGYRHQWTFGATASGISLGRYPTSVGADLAPMSALSFGTAVTAADPPAMLSVFRTGAGTNNPAPRVGPVVIDEIMYQPSSGDADDEFIELHNVTDATVQHYDASHPANTWRLRGGVEFDFAGGTTLGPRGYLLLVNFNPTNEPAKLTNFRSLYGVPESVPIHGPYTGRLDDSGDTVALYRPDSPQTSPPDAGYVPQILVDRVAYGISFPWPTVATSGDGFAPAAGGGAGLSLQRRRPSRYANDPVSWKGEAPTPGRGNVPGNGYADADHDGMADDWETANGFSAANPADAALDADGDGRSNYEEFLDGTNPNLASSRLDPPVITAQPQGRVVLPGTNITFNVSATGTGPLRYRWSHNDVPLAGETNAALALVGVQSGQSGNYQVTVFNAAGFAMSETATLTINIPPSITLQPASQSIAAGGSATFTVVADGTGVIRYQWQFNRVNIDGATSPTLTITGANLGHEGEYSVLVTDDIATISSAVARLSVRVPPIILVPPQGVTNRAGSDVMLSVVASGSVPMGFQWRKSSATLTNMVLLTTNSTFTLRNAATNASGLFRVVITNSGNMTPGVASAFVNVLVTEQPLITNQPLSLIVDPGSNVTFTVGARGFPGLAYQWYFNDTLQPGATGTSLTILNAQAVNQGGYRAVVSNAGGVVTSSVAGLALTGSLGITTHPQSQDVAAGGTANFNVAAFGTGPFSYQWLRDSGPLNGKTDPTLVIPNVQAADAGFYAAVVSNPSVSLTSQVAVLTVVMPPVLSDPEYLPGGQMQFKLSGNTNRNYFIEVSGNVKDWTTLTNVLYTNGFMPFIDPTSPGVTNRFYRARLAP